MIGEVVRYIEENNEKNIQFLIQRSSTLQMKTKKHTKYKEIWDGIKNKTENTNDGECRHDKDF